MDNSMRLYANGNGWAFDDFTSEKIAAKPWYRVVIKVWPAVEGDEGYNPADADHPFHRELWINGVKVGDQIRGDNTFYRVGFAENNIPVGSPAAVPGVWFLTGSDLNDTEPNYDVPMPCSTIAVWAVWDGLLTDEQIVLLGNVSK
jgi:hypothetical protein